ncbi:MAG: TonB-dependent receptor [Fibrobacterales bacterium]
MAFYVWHSNSFLWNTYIYVVILFFSLCTSGFALPSDTIIVSEKLPTASTLYKNQSTVIIKESEWLGKENSLADILAKQTAVQTRQFGGIGSFQSVTIRGQSGSRVMVCIDDVPINSAAGGAVDLGKIDLSLYERIEIYKSFIPAKFGVSSVGGVINLISKKNQKESTRVDMSLGSFQTFHNTISYTAKLSQKLTSQSMVSVIHSDNDFKFLNRKGNIYNPGDDSVMQRMNDDYTAISGAEIVTGKVLGGSIVFKIQGDYNSKGLAGKEYTVTNKSTIRSLKGSVLAHYKKRWYSAWYPELMAGIESNLMQVKHSIFHDDYPRYVNQDTEAERLNFSFVPFISWRIMPNEQWLLYTKALYSNENLVPQYVSGSTIDQSFEARRQSVKSSTEISYYPVESVTVHSRLLVSSIWDKRELLNHDNYWNMGYSAGLHYSIHSESIGDVVLFTIGGSNYRIASIEERYGTNNGIRANDTLKPEKSFEWEAGVRFERKNIQAEVVYFSKEVRDWVGRKYSGGIMKYVNEDKVYVNGIEMMLTTLLFKRLFNKSALTIQGSENLTNKPSSRNKLLPYVPFFTLDNTVEYTVHNLTVGYGYAYQSSMYRDLSNTRQSKPASQHDVFLKMKVSKNSMLTAGIYDIASSYSANESAHDAYPSPGQNLKIHITINK